MSYFDTNIASILLLTSYVVLTSLVSSVLADGNRIVNGVTADYDDHPWMVYIEICSHRLDLFNYIPPFAKGGVRL